METERDINFKAGLVQMAMGDDPEANRRHAVDRVRAAASAGAQVIGLPELYRSRYFCQTENPDFFDLAEPVDGPSVRTFQDLARDLRVAIVVPFFEKRAPGLYHNSAAVIDADGSVAGFYRKMHIPDDPGYYEKFYFTPGDLGYRVFNTAFGRVGVLICWDQWYPEAARLTALQGADLILYPTAIGWSPRDKGAEGDAQFDSWQTVQRGHAIASGVYIAAVNRIGFEPSPAGPGIEFWGGSFVADPQGRWLARGGLDEEILIADISRRRIDTHRRAWPFLRDRRIDSYAGLDRRFIDGEPRVEEGRHAE